MSKRSKFLSTHNTDSWEVLDFMDLQPAPGEFIGQGGTFDMYGDQVQGLNWSHAWHQWVKRKTAESGGEHGRCCVCGAHVRYVLLFSEPGEGSGKLFMVGRECAKFVQSKLDPKAWDEFKLTRDIRTVTLQSGETRCVLSLEVPEAYWQLPKELRPKFCSVRKSEVPVYRRDPQGPKRWYLSIWGANEGEVVDNHRALKALLKGSKVAA